MRESNNGGRRKGDDRYQQSQAREKPVGLEQTVRADKNKSHSERGHHYMVLMLDHEAAEGVTLESVSKLVDCGHITASYIDFPWASWTRTSPKSAACGSACARSPTITICAFAESK